MIEVIDYLMNHIKTKLSSTIVYAPIKVDTLEIGTVSSPKKSIALRLIPSPSGTQYLEGEIINRSFQLLTKSPNQKEALATCEAITKELRKLTKGQQPQINNELKITIFEVYVEPAFVEITEAKEYIYTAMFRAEILED